MKLTAFSVKDYRSILSTEKLPIRENLTVLIGPNNEGKSNLLNALANSLHILERLRRYARMPDTSRGGRRKKSLLFSHTVVRGGAYRRRDMYEWVRDYPVSKQKSNPKGSSVFTLEFELSPLELSEFREAVGSSLNGTLPVQLQIGQAGVVFKVRKQGPGAATLSSKVGKIAEFISSTLDFQYIPAIRTTREVEDVVEQIVERELAVIEDDDEYSEAVEKISKLQAPVLKRISDNVTKTLKAFLPEVSSVKVSIPSYQRSRALRRTTEIVVDDGTPTALSSKGDGVISLAAISLMHFASTSGVAGRNLILAIEEPESHLHPRGIHQLHDVIREIAENHQVIISTHNQGFVEHLDIAANLIVEKKRVRPAKTIADIRNSLGVRVSDNLQNSEVVLVVEGEDDRTAMLALLSHYSPKLKAAIQDNRLGIDSLGGGTNLNYKLSQLRLSLCRVYCLLDNDDCGQRSYEKAKAEGLLKQSDVTFTRYRSFREAEIEDWYDTQVYEKRLAEDYDEQVLKNKEFRNSKKKWSDRLKDSFEMLGKRWDDAVQKKLKADVACAVASDPGNALKGICKCTFDSLVDNLKNMLG